MQINGELRGDLINSIFTKFYFRGKRLYYQLILKYGKNEEELICEYEDYETYLKAHKKVLEAKSENRKVPNTFVKASKMTE